MGPFFSKAMLTDAASLSVLYDNTVPSINILFYEEKCFIQEDGVQPCYGNDGRYFLQPSFSC
jgi:hypothetical protein